MFAPQSSPAGRLEGQNPKTKDVVFCERSAFPLAVPSALVAAIWDQVNEGLRAVPRGGAEVGGLLLGRQSQTGIILAEEVVPIRIEYRFGPSFRLSDLDRNGIQSLMASVQKDPSKAVVAFYRSRTRNDSHSQESDSDLLSVLEQAHTSFSSNFHYYIAFTPLSKLSMTASVSLRKEDGWDDWQHMTLRSNPMSPSEPIEFETPPKAAPAPAPVLEQSPARPPAAPPPVPYSEPRALTQAEPHAPPQPPTRAFAYPDPRSLSHSDWMPGSSALEPASPGRRVGAPWYIAGAVLLAALGLGAYLRFASPQQPRVTISEVPVAPPAAAAVHTGFSATREGPLWRLTWDRAAVAALNPTGAVLAIRDGGKEQQVGLTLDDLSSGTILYTPQTGDLLFSLNIVMPGSQLAEEHVRVLEAPHTAEAQRVAETPPEPVKTVRGQVRTTRPFTPPLNGPSDSQSGKIAPAEMPPPPALASGVNPPRTSALPLTASMSAVPVISPPPTEPGVPAPVTVGARVVSQVSPRAVGPIPEGANAEVHIHVQIDARGAVTRVTPIGVNAFNFRLADAAARAAKYWVFEPAQTNGHPVASEMDLTFHFTK